MNPIKIYAKIISNNPWIILTLVIVTTIISIISAQNIKMESMDYKDILPKDLEIMKSLDYIGNEYGGSESVMIAIELEERKDIREKEIIEYINLLSQGIKTIDKVTRVTSVSTIINLIKGNIPKNQNEINELINNPIFNSYISKDYKLSIIRISLSEDYNEDEIIKDLSQLIKYTPKISGIKVSLAGENIASPIVRSKLGPDMKKTSRISLIGIIFILFILFRHPKYALTPLTTIGIGILWAFGYIGFIGMGMTSATSGVISMIMGIGIDFGIQIVTRFKEELKTKKVKKAMEKTIESTLIPMGTTTLAALIGFKAMSLGNLTMMAEMGIMMSYGVAACFLASITAVPAILIISEKIGGKK